MQTYEGSCHCGPVQFAIQAANALQLFDLREGGAAGMLSAS